MSKWEYLSVSAMHWASKGDWFATYIGGKKVDDEKNNIVLTTRINSLGDEGWELVSEHLDDGRMSWEYNFFYVSNRMKPFEEGGKRFTKDNWNEYLDLLGKANWELVDSYFAPAQGIFGTPEAVFIFKRVNETRIRRLQFKKPK